MEHIATTLAVVILALAPLMVWLEWRNWKHRKKICNEISEMLERQREWIKSTWPEEG